MAKDTALFEGIKQGTHGPTLRLYTWSEEAITIGRGMGSFTNHQTPATGPLLVRPTGGGIVYHKTQDELTIAFTHYLERGQPILDLYRKIHSPFADILRELGFNPQLFDPNVCHSRENGNPGPRLDREQTLDTRVRGYDEKNTKRATQSALECFPNPTCHDIMLDGKKIMGGGLRVGGKCFLYQGTLKLPNLKQEDFLEALLQNQTFQNNWGMPIMKIISNVV